MPNLTDYMDKFETISLAASKEHTLEASVEKMKSEWESTKLNTSNYK